MLANESTAYYWHVLRGTIFALSLTLASGCTTIPKDLAELNSINRSTGPAAKPIGELPPPIDRTWPDTKQDVLNQRARGFGLVNAPELQRYLNGLYARLKTQAGVSAWPGGVHILANESLEAYATGAGNIYVSLQWLKDVESEDELVALLSHEFGHIYLHYHKLEGAVVEADTLVGFVSKGIELAQKTGQPAGWTKLDSLSTAYTLGRGLATTVYSRSQESAADNFGLNLSLKLGYSYEHGMKACLERFATWEERNAKREENMQKEMLEAIRQESKNNVLKKNGNQVNALSQASGEISGGINSALQQFAFDIKKVAANLSSDHPETTERIDALAMAVEPFPNILKSVRPITQPLDIARGDKRTAAILKNYALAFEAINSPNDPDSLKAALASTQGPTSTHAVPLFALYTVVNEDKAIARKLRMDPGEILEANFHSEPDRTWITYRERSTKLRKAGKRGDASKVMEAGFAVFQNAEEAWPDAIRFFGEAKGWKEAQRMADICKKNFRHISLRCTQAAISPSEQANIERKEQEKAEAMVNRTFKKK